MDAAIDSPWRRDSAALVATAFIALVLPPICDAEAPGAWLSQTPPDFAWRWTVLPSSGLAPPQNAEVKTRELQLGIGLASMAAGELDVGIGLDYQYTRHEYESVAGRDRDLHRLQLPIHFNGPHGAWAIAGLLAPGLAASSNVFKDPLKRVSSDDLLLSGRLTARRSLDARTSWFAGAAYDRAFGSPALYPVAGVEYGEMGRYALRIAFPDPALQIFLSGRQSLLLRAFPAGQRWHVLTDDFGGDFDYTLRAFRAELNWSVRLGRQLSLDLGAGYEFARHHDFVADRQLSIDADTADQWLVSLGLRWRGAPLPSTHGTHL